jgi:hypothetical protein
MGPPPSHPYAVVMVVPNATSSSSRAFVRFPRLLIGLITVLVGQVGPKCMHVAASLPFVQNSVQSGSRLVEVPVVCIQRKLRSGL